MANKNIGPEKVMEAINDYYSIKIGVVFTELRTRKHVSQDNAQVIGYSRRVVQSIEQRRRDISISDLAKMAVQLGVNLNELLKIPNNHYKKMLNGHRISEDEIRDELDYSKIV